MGTWRWDVQTGQTQFNELWAEIVGYTLAELAPINIQTWLSLAHPDDLKDSEVLVQKNFEGSLDYYDCECRMRHKNGSWVWVQDRGKVAEWTAEGKPLIMTGTHTDITKRKQAEKEIRRLNEELEERVVERTAQLDDTILQLRREICERQQAEERVRAISSRLNDVRENERTAIAKELHDEVGQLLTGLRMMITVAERRFTAPIPQEFIEMHETVSELMMRVREMSVDLRPLVLDYLGLIEALVFYCNRYGVRTGIAVQFEKPQFPRRLNMAIETSLFRIVQEALTNIARHAGVREASVKMWIEEARVGVIIEDQGKGFDPSTHSRITCGLSGMSERARALGGQLEIDSRPGEGTRVRGWVPLDWA